MADTYTTNLNLKKPGYDSYADIKDLNDNFDKIDTAIANAGSVKSVNGKTGDVVLSASDIGAATVESVGQLSQQKVDKANVVNNFTTTAEGYVADARALKVLNDKLARTGYTPTFIGCTNNNVICYKIAGLVLVSGRFDVGESAITGVTNFISGLPVGGPNMDILALDMSSNGEHVRVQFAGTAIRTVYTTLKANQQYSINLVYVAD